MRTKHLAIVVCAAAILCAASVSVTGQQEPLPSVTPKQSADVPAASLAPAVVLVSEPIREFHEPTLEEAARNNDYVTFDALYRAAKQRGEDVSRFATLHELWTWAISDPVGAFYGRETHARLARAYPGYSEFIGNYAIIDSNGNTFWPTSETRIFLLARATAGDAPRMQLADVTPRPATRAPRAATSTAAAPTRKTTVTRTATTPKATTTSRASTPSVATTSHVATNSAATTAPVVIKAEPTSAPASASTDAPSTAAAPTTTPAPVVETPAPATIPVTTTTPAATRRENSLASRGILLLVLGLIGVGLLAVIFRTPREEDTPHAEEAEPHANVEPIRKAAEPKGEEKTSTRASGSRG